jgi:flavin-dependent dehydrogenase
MYDVVVVGAGPGGSTTARFAAERGLKVLMLDKRREIGYPVQCGEFMPDTNEMKRMFPRCGNIDTPITGLVED